MGNHRGLGFHLIFISFCLVATTYTCLGVQNITSVFSEEERLALVKFKQSVEDNFGMLSSWVGNDCCRWERVHCDGVNGNVESLDLRGDIGSFLHLEKDHLFRDDNYLIHDVDYNYLVDVNYLVGNEVNSSLAELRNLKYLDLSGNDFRGSRIPEFIGSFKHLSYLNLSNVGFQGIIPHHIGNISKLNVLDLSSNSKLMADDMSWTLGLSSLMYLDLSTLNLSGAHNWDMVLYMIPSLKDLSFSGCALSNAHLVPCFNSSRILSNLEHQDLGFISFKDPFFGFFRNMTSLSFLDLSGSDFSLAWNIANLLNMMPFVSEMHLSSCGLDKTFLSSPRLNSSTLSNSQHLDLSNNSTEGIFPSVLTNMSSLRVLDLSHNWLNSSVLVMHNLLELDLSFNRFKQIEHVGMWRQCQLKQLHESYNYFDIEMVDSHSPKYVSGCSRYALERLDLHRSLNSTIPKPLERMENLRAIDLSNCGLSGPIPKSLGRLRFLEELDLSYNQLTGHVPTFLGKISKLDLSFNQLNGSIPESFRNLSALTRLNLGSNRLTGPIPTSLGRLVSLQELWLYSNSLNGTIPVSVEKLVKLHTLDVSNNSLEGLVSEAYFAKLSMLKHLDTSSNSRLTFNVSRAWIPPFQLTTLLLSSCNIPNGFPEWLQNQRKLEMLVLCNTTMSGTLPIWLRKIPIIPFLDLSHNKLTGPLTNLPNGRNLDVFGYGVTRALFLEDNLFNDSIPTSLCRITNLELLDLSRNRLTGKIPRCIGNLHWLLTMRFSSNRLTGVIPSSIALNSSSLLWLELNDNNLTGEFPRELVNIENLEVLDLGNNRFFGDIPQRFGVNSSSLVWLKLNDNRFSGELPREMGNLRNLKVLDLGDNRFSGKIPEWIGERLRSLTVLRLHRNNFTGGIPLSLCKSSNLQILDVACNNLMGTIPYCLGELNAMVKGSPVYSGNANLNSEENVIQGMKGVDLVYTTTLDMVFNMDLSSNNLVGEIPVELTALAMLVGLNLSNNHLRCNIPFSVDVII